MEQTQVLRDLQVHHMPQDDIHHMSLNLQVKTSLDFWRDAYPGQAADIMVSQMEVAELKTFLEHHSIEYSIMVENVQSLIEEARPRNMSAKGAMDWDDYYPHEDLQAFIQVETEAEDEIS